MKKILYTIITFLLLATTANAQFLINKKDKMKTNVDGNLTFTKALDAWTVGGVNIADIASIQRTQKFKLTEQVKGNYFEGLKSQSSEGAANYYMILTNDELEVSDEQQYMPTTPGGIVLSLDLYGNDSENPDNAIIPEGTYKLDESTSAGTCDIQSTFVRMLNDDNEIEYKTIKSGTVTVAHTEKGYKIDGNFVSDQGETFSIHYEGELTFENKSSSSADTLMKDNVDNTVFKGLTITAHGGDADYHRYTLQLFDGDEKGGIITGGIVVNVDLFSTTPADDNIVIADGTYKASPNYEDIKEFEPFTFLSGDCYTVIGYPLYIGTYIQDMRNSAETGTMLYGYANQGTITIKRDGERYNVKLDLTTRNGIHVTGEYPMGSVDIIDRRPGNNDEKLKEDKDLKFSNDTYSYAYLTPGYVDKNDNAYKGVNEFEIVMNDHITNESYLLDLIVPEDVMTPEGTYKVADVANNNYQPYTFVPGYYVGYTAVRKGTWAYEHYTSDSNEPDVIAAATDGVIQITKNDDGTYTVEYELRDDSEPQNTVTASWTGTINIKKWGF